MPATRNPRHLADNLGAGQGALPESRTRARMASLHAALKPGGRLVVIDFEKIPGRSSAWVIGHVRADRQAVIAEVTAAGFELERTHGFLRDNYFLEFRRR